MSTISDSQTDLFKALYLQERARKDHIYGNLMLPITALTFFMFGFSLFATNVSWSGRWVEAVASAFGVPAILFFVAALVMLRRCFQTVLTSDVASMEEFNAWAENRRRQLRQATQADVETTLFEEYKNVIAQQYDDLYKEYKAENESRLANLSRTVGAIFTALLCLVAAFGFLAVDNLTQPAAPPSSPAVDAAVGCAQSLDAKGE